MDEAAYSPMTVDQRFGLVCELIKTLPQEFKNKVIAEIVENVTGETQVTVTSNDELVSINFGRPLAWFCIPKAHALQLGVSIMEHAGARLEQVNRPEKKTDA